jgi:hypothetical protein
VLIWFSLCVFGLNALKWRDTLLTYVISREQNWKEPIWRCLVLQLNPLHLHVRLTQSYKSVLQGLENNVRLSFSVIRVSHSRPTPGFGKKSCIYFDVRESRTANKERTWLSRISQLLLYVWKEFVDSVPTGLCCLNVHGRNSVPYGKMKNRCLLCFKSRVELLAFFWKEPCLCMLPSFGQRNVCCQAFLK